MQTIWKNRNHTRQGVNGRDALLHIPPLSSRRCRCVSVCCCTKSSTAACTWLWSAAAAVLQCSKAAVLQCCDQMQLQCCAVKSQNCNRREPVREDKRPSASHAESPLDNDGMCFGWCCIAHTNPFFAFLNGRPQYQYQKEKQPQPFLVRRLTGTAAVVCCFSFWYWNGGEGV